MSLAIRTNAQKRKVSTTKKTAVSAKGSLSVEAGLIFNSGDVKPVARVQFYLLDMDLKDILSQAEVKPDDKLDLDLLTTFAFALSYPNLYQDTFEKSLPAVKLHSIYTATTDFQGKTQFSNLKSGNYYVYGFTKVGKSTVLWNLNTLIKAGQNSVTLDNNNAAVSF